ncbi:hypothetical protein Patl1_22158 [Pistacia atlantica]|uniref:Uncharacterized protein n=1 Tax=Pistacia atlantica TaxID=434234 RepID=A0ACC1BKA2_9ROSI|nr:hypothetical protein Patl1_22158 [Pistacia atlantica]
MDPRLEGCFSIRGAQKAIQLATRCLSRDPKTRPLMSEVVEALKPLPTLTDMASSSSYFQAMQTEHAGSNSNANRGTGVQVGNIPRNGQPTRSVSIPNGPHVSPYHRNNPNRSPKPSNNPNRSPKPNVDPGNNPNRSPNPIVNRHSC